MFTGIIETLGRISHLEERGGNLRLSIESPIAQELKIDQSVAHNGVCLTVVGINEETYQVDLIHETLKKSNFSSVKVNDHVNLERCLMLGDRLDGHMVQGHVDEVGTIMNITSLDGSYLIEIAHSGMFPTVSQGSVCVNGISLTVAESFEQSFKVAIIPYTWEHTNLQHLQEGGIVNLEFDILGKYIAQLMKNK